MTNGPVSDPSPRWQHRAARAALRTTAAVDRAAKAAKGVHDGLVIGLLGSSGLEAVDRLYYERTARYRDDAYNRSGLFEWEARAVERWFPPTGRVIVTAAGGGREVLALRALGFDAVGYESNPDLREGANALLTAEGHAPCVLPVERDRFPMDAGPVDALVVGWGSYMHMAGTDTRTTFLRDARDALRPNAPALLSFFVRDGDGPYFRAVRRVATPLLRLRHAPLVETGDGLAPTFAHWFNEQELRAEGEAGGFEVLEWSLREYGHAVMRARATQ